MQKIRIGWVFFLAALTVYTAPILAEEHLQRTISVSGEGRATAPPDMATVRTGVVTQGTKARDALDANNAAMDRIMASLKSHNVAEC